jgi:hypothetical protein
MWHFLDPPAPAVLPEPRRSREKPRDGPLLPDDEHGTLGAVDRPLRDAPQEEELLDTMLTPPALVNGKVFFCAQTHYRCSISKVA